MEEIIKKELKLERLESFGGSAGGCISKGGGYRTDRCGDVFIKFNNKPEAKRMFDGEYASLEAMYRTNTIKVPKPIKSISSGGQSCLVTEYVNLNGPSKPAELGRDLARMHLHNSEVLAKKGHESGFVGQAKGGDEDEAVTKFGFHVTTCCGYIPQNNEWCDDWVLFFSSQRLKSQIDLLLEKHGDRELLQLWPELERKIPTYFEGCKKIVPSILHGDLWSGNYSYCPDGPVIFDPASFYGHSEYEMGIMTMFGGFGGAVFDAYHKVIPKETGADKRIRLYELFHHLNHWNHFGGGYRGGSLSLMRSLS